MLPRLRSVVMASVLTASGLVAADDGYEHGRAGFGAFVVPPQLDELSQRDLQPGDGGIVLFVRPGSTADQLGIQVGDVIRSINDVPVQSFRDIRPVVRSAAPGDEVHVVVTGSDGSTHTLDGAFKPRLPRPGGFPQWGANWGGNPWLPPDDIIADQRQQLIREQHELEAAEADLAAARATLAGVSTAAWCCHVDLSVGIPLVPER
jgi:serine protease Do